MLKRWYHENPSFVRLLKIHITWSRQTNKGAGKRTWGADKQNLDQTNKHGRERPRFADLAATAELSLAFEKVAANWGSRQSQAKTTSSEATDHKGQATKEGRMWRR